MAKRQEDRVFYRVSMTASKLRLYAEHGNSIFKDDAEKDQLLADAAYAVQILMDFRNIVNGMVSLEDEPKDAARLYLD